MGLAISRSLIEAHGGQLWATSSEGRGAAFHFTLPAGSSEEAQSLTFQVWPSGDGGRPAPEERRAGR